MKDISIENINKYKIKITGMNPSHPTAGYRLWEGIAESSEPIVALTFLETERNIFWARSSHKTSSSIDVYIQFSPYDKDGKDISVSFGIGDSLVAERCRVASISYQPTPIMGEYMTGELIKFAEVACDSCMNLWMLFIARMDVKSSRNGNWRLKDALRIKPGWEDVFTRGKKGVLAK